MPWAPGSPSLFAIRLCRRSEPFVPRLLPFRLFFPFRLSFRSVMFCPRSNAVPSSSRFPPFPRSQPLSWPCKTKPPRPRFHPVMHTLPPLPPATSLVVVMPSPVPPHELTVHPKLAPCLHPHHQSHTIPGTSATWPLPISCPVPPSLPPVLHPPPPSPSSPSSILHHIVAFSSFSTRGFLERVSGAISEGAE